jgi:hypothetical protein
MLAQFWLATPPATTVCGFLGFNLQPSKTLTLKPRSGWQPPRDYGLWGVSDSLLQRALAALSGPSREYWEAENSYFDRVTSISGEGAYGRVCVARPGSTGRQRART